MSYRPGDIDNRCIICDRHTWGPLYCEHCKPRPMLPGDEPPKLVTVEDLEASLDRLETVVFGGVR